MKRIRTEVCVVGGGAAGMMAAAAAADCGAEVLVLERQERPVRKLRITGKGRCNLTNNCSPEDVLKHVTRNARFLYSSVAAFPPLCCYGILRSPGCTAENGTWQSGLSRLR